jgi:hypothetical protein
LIEANESKAPLHEQHVRNVLARPSYILNSYRHMKAILDAPGLHYFFRSILIRRGYPLNLSALVNTQQHLTPRQLYYPASLTSASTHTTKASRYNSSTGRLTKFSHQCDLAWIKRHEADPAIVWRSRFCYMPLGVLMSELIDVFTDERNLSLRKRSQKLRMEMHTRVEK